MALPAGLDSAFIFEQLGNIVKTDTSLVERTNVILLYRIKKGDKVTPYTVDLKNAPGSVYQGESKNGKPDCELSLSDEDFVKLVTKQANPQNLFMQGKLKLKGNMAAGLKFEKVLGALNPAEAMAAADSKEAKKPAAAAAAAATKPAAAGGAGGFASKAIFDQLAAAIKSDPSLVGKTGVILLYRLSKAGKTGVFTIDLKNAPGAVYEGEVKNGGKADVELTLSDDDFMGLVTGKAKAQTLFMGGKLKLKGNMGAAMKFEKVLSALAPRSAL